MPKSKDVMAEKTTKSSNALTAPSFGIDGKEAGSLELPKELFAGKINKSLNSQAVRVYLNNQTAHFGNTKTRGEVQGSTRKIYKQKGTGGARHGAVRAPIFVGGGIAMGPKYRKVELDLPKKMKKAAFISILSDKAAQKQILGLADAEKLSGKTKQVAQLLKALNKENALFLVSKDEAKLSQAVRNVAGSRSALADQVNILDLVSNSSLVLTKKSVEALEKRINKIEVKGESK